MVNSICYQQKWTSCNKKSCKKCPFGHGPYWYAAMREGHRMRWKYIGKALPPGATGTISTARATLGEETITLVLPETEVRTPEQVYQDALAFLDLFNCDDEGRPLTREKARKKMVNRLYLECNQGARAERCREAFAEICAYNGWAPPKPIEKINPA